MTNEYRKIDFSLSKQKINRIKCEISIKSTFKSASKYDPAQLPTHFHEQHLLAQIKYRSKE